MTRSAFRYGSDWFVRAPDGKAICLNSEDGANIVLGLWEEIDALDARLKKRAKKRAKSMDDMPPEGFLDEA